MTAARLSTDPIVVLDVEDLAEADLEADLAERLELAGLVHLRPGASGASGAAADEVERLLADAVSLASAIRRGGPAAAAVHRLGPEAAMLAG